ncbi:MAG TPA: metallopeptidase TldD-related protein [Kofleriaceae bacterium]|nr:metallopeptidase TldD-related protein [Kofleriaceae bacterium]
MRTRLGAVVAAILAVGHAAGADVPARFDGPLARALKSELARGRALTMPGAGTTYHLAYRVLDTQSIRIEADRGGLVERRQWRQRRLAVDMRVGDRNLDSSNYEDVGFRDRALLTIDDNLAVLQRQIWLATDAAYKDAAERLEKKRAFVASRTAPRPPELSIESPAQTIVEREPPALDADALAALAIELSAAMPLAAPAPYDGRVRIDASSTGRTYIDSDGTFAYEPSQLITIEVSASMQGDDDATVVGFTTARAVSMATLQGRERLLADVTAMMKQLDAQRRAPVTGAYAGPVLFEGEAGPQLLRYLLAGNLCGTPRPAGMRNERMAGSMGLALETELGDRVGKTVLPAGFDVVDDPLADRIGNSPLFGGYAADDEGRPAARVTLVHDGILRAFLMSRTPRIGMLQSNAHGRGLDSVRAHPANLLVSTSRGVSAAELRRKLLAEAKRAGEKYGLRVRALDDPGITGRYQERADMFEMLMGGGGAARVPAPLQVYRVWPDGREELVRGALFAQIPVTALRELLAAGKDTQVHDYLDVSDGGLFGMMAAMFGAEENGDLPVSLAAPALLLRRVEVHPAERTAAKPYVLSPPK